MFKVDIASCSFGLAKDIEDISKGICLLFGISNLFRFLSKKFKMALLRGEIEFPEIS
jgi:hypothetical protein